MRYLPLLAVALLLPACTAGPDYTRPEVPTPEAYATPGPEAPPATETPAPAWWRGYDDARLEALVAEALSGNLDIAAAEARLDEARALVEVARADGGPTLDGTAGTTATSRLAGDSQGNGDRTQGSAEGGLIFGWIPDLFGGQRRAEEAAEAEAQRAALERDDRIRQVVAEVVRTHLEIRRDRTRLRLIDDSLDLQRQTLAVVRERFNAGLASQLDVSRAEAQTASTRARRGPLLRTLATNRAALAVLTGKATAPAESDGEAPLPGYRGGILVGLPRDLLRDRPDVQAAEAALMAATAQIGVAEADLYPSLSIPGSLTLSASGLGTGDVVDRLIASLGAALDIPIFDSGARRATITAAEARAREALLAYRATLLDAVADVETALGELSAARDRQTDLQEAVAASEVAFQQAEGLYREGLVGFLDVLAAQGTLLDNRQALAEAQADVVLLIADLHAALGTTAS